MELSPEEKRKIYEEEKARLEAIEKPKSKQTRHGMGNILALVVILLIGALAWGAVTQSKLSTTKVDLATTQANLSKTHADLVSTQVIAISSAGPSWFGDVCER